MRARGLLVSRSFKIGTSVRRASSGGGSGTTKVHRAQRPDLEETIVLEDEFHRPVRNDHRERGRLSDVTVRSRSRGGGEVMKQKGNES